MHSSRRTIVNIILYLSLLLLIIWVGRPSSSPKRFVWSSVRYETSAATLPDSRGICPGVSTSTKPALVVARVNNDGSTAWLDKLKTRFHVCTYTANARLDTESYELQVPANRGHEAMAYLTFIIDNYDQIPREGAVFVHGSRFAWHNDHPAYDNAKLLLELNTTAALALSGYHNLRCDWSGGTCTPSVKAQGSWETMSRTILEPNNQRAISDAALPMALVQLFGTDEKDTSVLLGRRDAVRAQCCAQFVVSRTNIHRHARAEYIAIRQWLLDGVPVAGDDSDMVLRTHDPPPPNRNAAPADDRIAGRILSYVWHILFMAHDGYGTSLADLNRQACPTAAECYCLQKLQGSEKALRQDATEVWYCTSRNLNCVYTGATSASTGIKPGLGTGQWLQYTPESTQPRGSWAKSPGSQSMEGVSRDALRKLEVLNLGGTFWSRARSVIASHDMSPDEVADHFFDGTRTWLPIICPKVFRLNIRDWQNLDLPPDLSMLLLAMCLQTCPPSSHVTQPSSGGLQGLYVTAKSTFAQVQLVLPVSTPLIQAAVLLATYEYACGLFESAYLSLGSAFRMCHVAGIRGVGVKTKSGHEGPRLEEHNVWWGIVTLERHLALEFANLSQYPMALNPKGEDKLPVQLGHPHSTDASPESETRFISLSTPSDDIGGFGRQAQGVFLLDQIFTAYTSTGMKNASGRIKSLQSVDSELQTLLAIAMGEYKGPGAHCGAVATCLRTLFYLHQAILEIMETIEDLEDDECKSGIRFNSKAACATAIQMMTEAACDHSQSLTNIGRLPICAGYNFELCMRHKGVVATHDDQLNKTAGGLKAMVDAFRRRWPLHEKAQYR